eukprot:763893-Hanusia_phi.AAC.1
MRQKMLLNALSAMAAGNMIARPTAISASSNSLVQNESSVSPSTQDAIGDEPDLSKKGKMLKAKKVKPAMRKRSFWSDEEHQQFMDALKKYNVNPLRETKADGKLYVGLGPYVADMIAIEIGTRNAAQVRSHAQKYFQKTSISK